jgi:ATP-dependent protease HslVU (ClpYQ) peptidase subunit
MPGKAGAIGLGLHAGAAVTCIVGLVHQGTVWLGGDSAAVEGTDYTVRRDLKVFQKDQMLFGFTSSFRMGQLIQTSLVIPEHSINVDDFTYLTSTFMDAVLTCFQEKAFAKIDDNVATGGTFLIGYRGGLYEVNDDYQVGIPTLPYEACGCGAQYAKGALKILETVKLSPRSKVIKALEASAAFCCGVQPPYHCLSLAGEERNS